MKNKFKEGDVVYYHEMNSWTGVPTEHDGALLVVEEVRHDEGTIYMCRALNQDERTAEFDCDGFMTDHDVLKEGVAAWIVKAPLAFGIMPACDLPDATGVPLKAPQDTSPTLTRLRASAGKPKVDLMEGFDDPCKTNQRSFEIQHCINGLKGLPAMNNGVDTLTVNKAVGYLEGMLK